MLIIGREVGQSVIIADDIKVTVQKDEFNLKLEIKAPKDTRITKIKETEMKQGIFRKTDRKIGDTILIGDNILITLLKTKNGLLRFAIDAPKEISVYREEIYEKFA
ncbi:carbon storage regulator [Pullulanibacillus sp. KACC 23026]|uniref:carbon storage regulator n=1 Tax=Pullulanibacillus sp. KACC 23026 TaxID=3028315 RepID=UPI0023B195EE|nr:carbon storage regulator [Pullulanibacillus sp. KACC 23026]WEG11254.1 carbon storage regulator [Pullulanibacillus sp. KACC 23026]